MNDYVILGELGKGMYGKVFKVRERKTNCVYALKQMAPVGGEDEGIPASALVEVGVLLEVEHPNIIRLHKTFATDQCCLCAVLECMDTDLSTLVNPHNRRKLRVKWVKDLMRQLLSGLVALHDAGFIHRDIKPQNLLVNKKTGRLKLADFGLATARQRHNDPDVITYPYRPPEVLIGESYDARVDVWSAGCVFAEMLTCKGMAFGNISKDVPESQFNVYVLANILANVRGQTWAKGEQHLLWKQAQNLAPLRPRLHINRKRSNSVAMDLLVRMLTLDPTKRMTAKQALQHKYFSKSE